MGRKSTEHRIGVPRGYRNTAANTRAAQWVAENTYRGPKKVTENKTPLSLVVKSVLKPDYLQEDAVTNLLGVIFPNPSLKLSTLPQLRAAITTMGPEESLGRLHTLQTMHQNPLQYKVAYAGTTVIRTSRTPYIVSLYPDAVTEQAVASLHYSSIELLGAEGAGTARAVAAGRFVTEQQAAIANEVLHNLLAGTTLQLGPAKTVAV